MKNIKNIQLIFILLGCCSCSTQKFISRGIPNLHVVDYNQNIYRGGQPTFEGWQWLESMCVTNIIKLNEGTDSIPTHLYNFDEDRYRDCRITVHNFPINTIKQLFIGPNADEVAKAVSYIQPNTYIHCEHGQDRTGLIVGMYRLKNKVPKKEVEKQMLDYGFHKTLFGLWFFWKSQPDIK